MKIVKILKGIQVFLKALSAITICMLTVILAMQIVKRSVFLSSFTWAEELSTICMVWLTFLGAATAVSSNQHTRIDFFIMQLPEKIYRGFLLFSNLACIGFIVVMIKYSWKAVLNNLNNLTPALKLPVSVNYLGLFVGCILMIIYFVLQCWLEVQHIRGIDVSAIEEELQK